MRGVLNNNLVSFQCLLIWDHKKIVWPVHYKSYVPWVIFVMKLYSHEIALYYKSCVGLIIFVTSPLNVASFIHINIGYEICLLFNGNCLAFWNKKICTGNPHMKKKRLPTESQNKCGSVIIFIETFLWHDGWRLLPCAWQLVAGAWRPDHNTWRLVRGAWWFVSGASCLASELHDKANAWLPIKTFSMNFRSINNNLFHVVVCYWLRGVAR